MFPQNLSQEFISVFKEHLIPTGPHSVGTIPISRHIELLVLSHADCALCINDLPVENRQTTATIKTLKKGA